nr:hypothetical protein [Tanacetum cinerariifolium]
MHQTYEKSSLAMTHKLDDMIELPKSQPKETYKEDLECDMVMVMVKPQPQPLRNFPSLDVSLGEERGPKLPIKPPSLDSFKMKEVDHLTNHTPPSPHVASFYPKDMYCYYHLCIDDLKKHYEFKPGLLGSLTKSLSNLEVT